MTLTLTLTQVCVSSHKNGCHYTRLCVVTTNTVCHHTSLCVITQDCVTSQLVHYNYRPHVAAARILNFHGLHQHGLCTSMHGLCTQHARTMHNHGLCTSMHGWCTITARAPASTTGAPTLTHLVYDLSPPVDLDCRARIPQLLDQMLQEPAEKHHIIYGKTINMFQRCL